MQGGIVCISLRKNGSLINLACERRRASEIGIADSCNDLGAMAWAIAPELTVTVDRPLGSYHPEHKDMYYPINYGYVEGIMAPDGEEQDAYILGVDEAIEKFTGKIIAIVHRNDDVEEKWVVAPEGMTFTKEEIREQIHFQEQYFDSEIVM